MAYANFPKNQRSHKQRTLCMYKRCWKSVSISTILGVLLTENVQCKKFPYCWVAILLQSVFDGGTRVMNKVSWILLKVNKSQKQNCWKKTCSKNERTSLFFYPDSPELPETWDFNFKFQIFLDRQDRKTNLSVHFWKKFWLDNFAFEIYWPLVDLCYFALFEDFSL